MKNILITGITGTLGTKVCEALLLDPSYRVYGFSRDEQKQRNFKKHPRLTMILGDVRDKRRVIESTRNTDLIFHFAALKCVDTLEDNPEESIATNIEGTMNVLGAQRINKIPRVVLSSTDKAVYPINVYGECKALAEKLVLRNKNNIVIRYGNVLASRGSVIPYFIKTLREEKKAYITHEDMTRFFLTPEQATDFVIQCGFGQKAGLRILSSMKSISMLEIVMVLSKMIGVTKPAIVYTGVRPGEKIHENLVADHEGMPLDSRNAPRYSEEEMIELLTPIVHGNLEKRFKKNKSSQPELMT